MHGIDPSNVSKVISSQGSPRPSTVSVLAQLLASLLDTEVCSWPYSFWPLFSFLSAPSLPVLGVVHNLGTTANQTLLLCHLVGSSSNPAEALKLLLCSRSVVCLFATPRTEVHQAPLSMKFLRQEYWSGLPFPSPGHLPSPRTEPRVFCIGRWILYY